jgi:hypothetical protein
VQLLPIDAVEERHDVGFDDPIRLAGVRRTVERLERVVRPASAPEAVRAVEKRLLVNSLQHFTHSVLHDLVFDRRDANRSRPSSVLRDVHASDRLMAVPARLHPLVQVSQLLIELLPVLLLRRAIHADGRIPADAIERPRERRLINEVRQRMELRFGFSFRSFRYLQKFR